MCLCVLALLMPKVIWRNHRWKWWAVTCVCLSSEAAFISSKWHSEMRQYRYVLWPKQWTLNQIFKNIPAIPPVKYSSIHCPSSVPKLISCYSYVTDVTSRYQCMPSWELWLTRRLCEILNDDHLWCDLYKRNCFTHFVMRCFMKRVL